MLEAGDGLGEALRDEGEREAPVVGELDQIDFVVEVDRPAVIEQPAERPARVS